MRPYVRYGIAKAMGKHFLAKEGVLASTDSNEQANYMADVQTNMFAAKLLTPAYLIRKELAGLDAGKDIVAQLADVFWMSKTFMNGRLKEIIEKNSEI
jgi:Zn-dependent peptidase ImmA (M78 family)